ncbi:MgtC family protein [Syntrophotalea carbinolica DSM 2380]|uniref:MgtC family protein n=1 Tax=Syntrophotalea carbinolica (strain DSM 2380 / NBRC 103641 / GraBd1) TaxID=338963 RepID=Q3A351_SYNC1|nr:MgtC family protein [Syntrophotalea carbinolica DSM 2380]
MNLLDTGLIHYDISLLGRLLLAALLGAMLGFEREIHGRPAGFRTHLLVTMGACLMMVVSEYFYTRYHVLSSSGSMRIDPGRVAAQIVTGIGFLGAGAIIKDGSAIRGLTTAACLWIAAGIGMAVGVGLYVPALAVTGMAVGALMFLKRLEDAMAKDSYADLTIFCDPDPAVSSSLEALLDDRGLRRVETAMEKDKVAQEVRYDFVVKKFGGMDFRTFVDELAAIPGVRKVRYR